MVDQDREELLSALTKYLANRLEWDELDFKFSEIAEELENAVAGTYCDGTEIFED